MTEDEVLDAVTELKCITTCRCAPAWTERGKHEVCCVAYCREDVDALSAELARLRAVADAARAVQQGDLFQDWIALKIALAAMDGGTDV